MPNERENFYQPITAKDYHVAGIDFRAWYDADGRLVFVLDLSTDETKPNAMLVINPDGHRKWDDILANDYGVDLETVRPKKDNKYQKLDIEYVGLVEYDALIMALESGNNVDVAVGNLNLFRAGAAKRAALERMAAADLTADKSRETIEKTTETIAELVEKLKKLRAKLADYRSNVGKEPTKQSAAKILRAESQIDAVSGKLGRAKKRLDNAKERLDAAEDDKEQAIYILRLLDDAGNAFDTAVGDSNVPMVAPEYEIVPTETVHGDVAVVQPAPVPMNVQQQESNIESKVDDMADEEVKPLFDTDPDILDENIAFKPIDFDVPAAPIAEPIKNNQTQMSEPLSFVPPVMEQPVVSEQYDDGDVVNYIQPVGDSVLDNLKPVETPTEQIDSELLETLSPTPVMPIVSEQSYEQPAPMAPVMPSQPVDVPQSPMPEIAPAPISSDFRPVSPITGTVPGTDVGGGRKKPTMLYYVMLIVLIALSVFALWVYQNKMVNDSMPELVAKTKAAEEVVLVNEPEDEKVDAEPVNVPAEPVVVDTAAVIAEDVVPESVTATPVEPVRATVEVEPVPVEITPEPIQVPVESDVVVAEEVVAEPVKKIPTEAEILASKPAYNVSQNEKMFVADAEYESEYESDVETEDVAPVVIEKPVVAAGATATIVQQPALGAAPETYAEDFVVEEVVETCADGNLPDADGCCAGEYLADVGGGEYACCVEETGECFPPMF